MTRLFLVLMLLWALPAQAAGLTLLRDEEIEQSLKVMSKPILMEAGVLPENLRFVVIDSPDMNAFVAGGQNIFLFTRLIFETQTPAELFGVIAHETGHIADGHLLRGQVQNSNLSMQAMLSMMIGMAVAVGARAPDVGMAISSVGSSVSTQQFLRHTRTQEGSADQAGVRYLLGAGLPVTGFLSFMKKLEAQELLPESQQSEYVRTHPVTQDRIDFLQHTVLEKLQGPYPPEWNELHARMKAKLMGYLHPEIALRATDNTIASTYGRAIAWFRRGQPDKSLVALDALMTAEPSNPYFYEFKGQMLFNNGRIEDAINAYAKAVELAPFSGLIRIAYAQALIESKSKKQEYLAEAIKQLEIALTKEKQTSDPHRLLAIAYGKQGLEGMSRLHLAEEALMQNKPDFAKREAGIAREKLKKGTPAYLRADDILSIAEQNDRKGRKKG